MKKMARIVLLVVLGLASFVFGQGASEPDEADTFFDDSYVHEIRITFEDPNWYDTLYDSHANDPDDPYHPGRFESEGIVLDPVGIRFKGNSSFNDMPTDKKSFKFDFDEYDEGNPALSFLGMKKLNLNNGFSDPTLLREKLFLDSARDYLPESRAVHTRVYVNDEYYGLYIAVEQIDKQYLHKHFGSEEDGNSWKAQPDGPPGGNLAYLGPDPAPYEEIYVLKTNELENDYTHLIEFIDLLNNTPLVDRQATLEPIFEVRTALTLLALNNLFVNLDSYTGASAHNYYLYDRDDSSRMTMLHWDTGLSFGRFLHGLPPFEDPLTLDPFWAPLPPPGGDPIERPLMEKLWEVDLYNEFYLDSLALMLASGFDQPTMSARIQQLADIIRTDVYADPRRDYTNAEFENNLTTDLPATPPNTHPIYGLENFVSQRAAYLNGLIDPLDPAEQFFINEVVADNETTIADEQGEFDDWVEIYNPGTADIDLSGYYFADSEEPLWQIPAGDPVETTVVAGGYLLFWFDKQPEQGSRHVMAKLGASGDAVMLYAPDGVQQIDSHWFGQQYPDVAEIRYPDGADAWHQSVLTTPGAANVLEEAILGCTDLEAINYDPAANLEDGSCEYPEDAGIRINEFVAKVQDLPGPDGTSDWLELFNRKIDPVDISGWTITDSPGDPSKTYTFPVGTVIAARGFLVAICDDSTGFDGTYHHVPFKLGGDDEVLLSDAEGHRTDYIIYERGLGPADGMTFDYPVDNADIAWGRLEDGEDTWGEIKPQTPLSSNNTFVVIDLMLSVSGNDVVLSWSDVVTDPEVSSYRIYRDSAPLRDADVDAGLHLYDEVVGVTEFTDAATGTDGWFYDVRAVDTAGSQSEN